MSINLELIEKLRERANVSYAEAREALEKCNGDLLEALIELEKEDKIKADPQENKNTGFWATLKRWVRNCNDTHLLISKNNETVINLSLTIVIILTILAAPIVIIGLLAALFTRHKIRLQKSGCEEMKINKTFDDISAAACKVSDQVSELISK